MIFVKMHLPGMLVKQTDSNNVPKIKLGGPTASCILSIGLGGNESRCHPNTYHGATHYCSLLYRLVVTVWYWSLIPFVFIIISYCVIFTT